MHVYPPISRFDGSSPHTRGARSRSPSSPSPPRIIPAYAGSTRALNPGGVFSADHPRIRGEHVAEQPYQGLLEGSSPHTRGAHPVGFVGGRGLGIIPAYAGSTRARKARCPSPGDHPRIRGEHRLFTEYERRGGGSSPHTRGARLAGAGVGRQGGIIPAYAGSTDSTCLCRSTSSDHPRIRGEHMMALAVASSHAGSSPHTRGALRRSPDEDEHRRIIPAYAGSTAARGRFKRNEAHHPRIRGEHSQKSVQHVVDGGSSPHTRGARCGTRRGCCRWRIIPAYAGSTVDVRGHGYSSSDHPRIRGEHKGPRLGEGSGSGSSPHTRGARARAATGPASTRIIPAYAGSTGPAGRSTPRSSDHPRIRGEHVSVPTVLAAHVGSSPHTRGARPSASRR